MSSLNTKKNKKRKLTMGKIARFQEQMLAHNKALRSKGMHDLQMDLQEFIDYMHGEYKPKPQKSVANNDFKPLKSVDTYRRPTTDYPSLDASADTFAPCTVKESKQYTGERQLLGIATMHKSNMVPVFADKKEQAEEIARMRR
jgi:hypothetical protein